MNRFKLARDVKLGIKTLMLHKLRSLLTMLGVVFGVGSVVAMLAVGEGASADALSRIRKLGSNNIIINSEKAAEDADSNTMRQRMNIYGLLYEDARRIASTFDAVVRTVPVKLVRKEGRLGARALELRVVGTTHEWFDLVRRDVIAGRVLGPADMTGVNNAVVLTEHGARRLLATKNTVGESIGIGGGFFEVIGIVKSESGSEGVRVPDENVDAYIPLHIARERFGDTVSKRSAGSRELERVELHQIIVEIGSTGDVLRVSTGVEAMLKHFHKKLDYKIRVPLALLMEAEATKRNFNIVLGSIAGISLLVGGIGIMNIMLASVTERTREIGVRRAIGAKKAQIVSQFLIETTVLSCSGGAIGIGIGLGIPWLITYWVGMPTVVTSLSIMLSVGISLAVGLIFGLYPAVKAANLDPIEALRHE